LFFWICRILCQNAICRKLCFFASIWRKVLLKVNECCRKLIVIIRIHWFQHVSTDFEVIKKVILTRETRNVQASQKSLMRKWKLYSIKNQTQKELAESLKVNRLTISRRLKAIEMIQKQGNWMPYELKPRSKDAK